MTDSRVSESDVKTLTREDYDRKKRHQYAGTVRTLEPETVEGFKQGNPKWDGKYWAMWFEDGAGTVLGPVNVVKDETTYPRTNDQGQTVWACCESSIGRPCAHERHMSDVEGGAQ